jgi:hypothetical protein
MSNFVKGKSGIIKPGKRGLFVPKHLASAYTRQGTPEVGSGQRLVSLEEIMPLMEQDESFREAVALMGRREGHVKAVQQIHRGGKEADYHVEMHKQGQRAHEIKASGGLDDTKTLAEAGVDSWQEARALGLEKA